MESYLYNIDLFWVGTYFENSVNYLRTKRFRLFSLLLYQSYKNHAWYWEPTIKGLVIFKIVFYFGYFIAGVKLRNTILSDILVTIDGVKKKKSQMMTESFPVSNLILLIWLFGFFPSTLFLYSNI